MSKKKKQSHKIQPRLEAELASSEVVGVPDESYTRVYHAVNPGDLIAAMGAIKKYYDITKRKCIVMQSISQLAAYYAGATHPTVNENGQNVCCNQPMFDMLKPLIESQEYVHSLEVYNGQRIDLDFNVIRGKTFVNLPNGAIQGWIPLAYPDLSFNMNEVWIKLPGECPEHIKKQVSGKVLLNFTERYRNAIMDYHFLKNYSPDLIFAGTEKEHWLFCNKWQLTIPRLEINDFLELSYAIKECRFLFANQSFNFNIASAMLTPRVLEVCQFAQNVPFMVGDNCHGFLHQVGAEYYFRSMYNKTNK